jgi:hypothetical protein
MNGNIFGGFFQRDILDHDSWMGCGGGGYYSVEEDKGERKRDHRV